MKKLLLILCILFAGFINNKIEAKGAIVYHNGEYFNVQEKLPAEITIDGKHVNLGVMYDQFGLFWMPIWNYSTPKYIFLDDAEKTYWDVEEEDLEVLKSEYNISIPDSPSPSLWNQIGLKPVIVLLVLFIIWGQVSGKKKEEEEVKPEEEIA